MIWCGDGDDPDPPTSPIPVGGRVRSPSRPAPDRYRDGDDNTYTAAYKTGSEPEAEYEDDDPNSDDSNHDDYDDSDYDDSVHEQYPQAPAGSPTEQYRPKGRTAVVLVPLLVGALVSVVIGVYGRTHEPAGYAVNLAGFSSAGYVKAWLGSLAVLLAIVQLVSARMMYGRGAASWVPKLHVWSGRLAVLVSVPVAMHCLYALGFQAHSTRVWVHSLAGCLVYGAFTAKMLSLGRSGSPRWAVPLLGGLTFTVLIVAWLTSALWLFGRQGVHL